MVLPLASPLSCTVLYYGFNLWEKVKEALPGVCRTRTYFRRSRGLNFRGTKVIMENRPLIEPAHEIMALFVLHKLVLQTRMHSHSVGLDVWFLVGPFIYFHTSCVRTAKAVARLCRCAGSPVPSLVACVISTIISWAGPIENKKNNFGVIGNKEIYFRGSKEQI